MKMLQEFTTTQLKQAVQIREQIDSLQGKLNALLDGTSPTVAKKKVGRPKGKRTISPEHRANLAAAQTARWAAKKSLSTRSTSSAKAAPKSKGMSAERKAKIAAAMKARWAAKKKGAVA